MGFPIMNLEDGSYGSPIQDCPRSIPWGIIEQSEAQAQHNHGQSLQRLAERGGLSPIEAYAVLRGIPYPYRESTAILLPRAVKYLNERIALFNEAQQAQKDVTCPSQP